MSKLKTQSVFHQHSESVLELNNKQPTSIKEITFPNFEYNSIGDRFVTKLKRNFTIMQENNIESQDIASPQVALEMLYKQQILEHQPIFEQESMYYINQSGFQYNTMQVENKNINNLFFDNKYFTISETLSNYYGKYVRKIQKVPFKVLDAPQLQDDFYLNLIDWSNQNILSVALNSCVYLWNANTSKVTKLLELHGDFVTSVAWSLRGPQLGVGTKNGEVQIWDAEKLQRIRTFKGHIARVGTLCFSENILSSGSRDKLILQRDLRQKGNFFHKQQAHKQEVCGLKWSPDGQMLASGGNDNKLYLWSAQKQEKPIYKLSEHQAAVKAIAWSPHQHGLLASGGGTADKMIRFWNALEGKNLGKEDTGSQVCNLMFSKIENEIISTHGYSQNQIIIWKCNGMKRISTLVGHTCRVLYLAMSPDGSTIVTGAGDETLRFWNIYPQISNETKQTKGLLIPPSIR